LQTDFDYAAVDYNEALDDLDQEQADASDRYFDEEDPAEAEPLGSDEPASLPPVQPRRRHAS